MILVTAPPNCGGLLLSDGYKIRRSLSSLFTMDPSETRARQLIKCEKVVLGQVSMTGDGNMHSGGTIVTSATKTWKMGDMCAHVLMSHPVSGVRIIGCLGPGHSHVVAVVRFHQVPR